jgi:hypothetical protein
MYKFIEAPRAGLPNFLFVQVFSVELINPTLCRTIQEESLINLKISERELRKSNPDYSLPTQLASYFRYTTFLLVLCLKF